MKKLEDAGVSAIAIHCRLPSDHTSVMPNYSIIEPIKKVINIPLTINGGLNSLEKANEMERSYGSR